MCIRKLKIQQLKYDIENKRRELNNMLNREKPIITDEVFHTSQQLDILIRDYYYSSIYIKNK